MLISLVGRVLRKPVLWLVAFSVVLVACGGKQSGELVVSDAYLNIPPKGALVAGGFMVIANGRSADVHLRSVETEAFALVEMHETKVIDGMMRMRPQEKVLIPKGAQVVFKPGGLHLMLMQPQAGLRAGETMTASVTFEGEDGETMVLQVPFEVRDPLGRTRP